jgi:Na+/H+ antiporter NhaD/arsenite permease-like protein
LDTTEDIIVIASIIVIIKTLFTRNMFFEINSSMERSENMDRDLTIKKAVNAQKIFLKGDVIIFLVFLIKKNDIPRNIKP